MNAIDTIQRGLGGATGIAGPGASEFAYKALSRAETLYSRLTHFIEKRRTRRALANLSEHQLRDIGVSRHEADREAGRPFWY